MPATPASPAAVRRARRILVVAALTGAAAVLLGACGSSTLGGRSAQPSFGASPAAHRAIAPPPQGGARVDIVNFTFTPSEVTVNAGTTIRWTNRGYVPHTVDFTDGVNSGVLNNGDRFTHTFSTPGTYSYICGIHPFMHGTVVVIPREENTDATVAHP